MKPLPSSASICVHLWLILAVLLTGCDLPSWVPIVGGPPSIENHRAGFLGEDANRRWMNYLNAPGDEWDHMLNWQEERDLNMLYLFLSDEGDGQYSGFSILNADGSQNKDFIEHCLDRVKKARRRGFGCIFWLAADDSPNYNRRPDTWQFALQAAAVEHFGPHASGFVVGLEADEYWNRARHDRLTANLDGIWDGPIGAHMTPNKTDFAHSPGITHYFGQFGWVRSAAELETKARAMLRKLPGHVKLILCEYDRSSDSGYGRQVVARDPRFVGFGNGFSTLPILLIVSLPAIIVIIILILSRRARPAGEQNPTRKDPTP